MTVRIAIQYSKRLLLTFLFHIEDAAQGIFVRADAEKQAKARERDARNHRQFSLTDGGGSRDAEANLSGFFRAPGLLERVKIEPQQRLFTTHV